MIEPVDDDRASSLLGVLAPSERPIPRAGHPAGGATIRALIIGSRSDPHVQAVASSLAKAPIVFVAATLKDTRLQFTPPTVRLGTEDGVVELRRSHPPAAVAMRSRR